MTANADLQAAVVAGVVGSAESYRALLSAIARSPARSSARVLLDPPARRGDGRARVRGGGRRGRGDAPRPRFPAGEGDRRLGARDAHAARDRGRAHRPALRDRCRRGLRLRPERPDGRAAHPRRAGARRARGARPARRASLSRSRRWSCSASSRTRPRSRSTSWRKSRAAEKVLAADAGDLEVVARLASAVDALEDERREAGLKLLGELAATLGARGVTRPRARSRGDSPQE